MTQLRTKCPYDGRTTEGRLWRNGYKDACEGLTPRRMINPWYMSGYTMAQKDGLSDRQKGMSDAAK